MDERMDDMRGCAADVPQVDALRAMQVLESAHAAWMRMAPLRGRRRRYARFTYGDQWGDPVRTRDGRIVTEGEDVARSQRPPLTNNLIRRLVKSVVGRFRQMRADGGLAGGGSGDGGLSSLYRFNRLDELDARTLEEFLISGMAIHHVCAERRPGGSGVWVDNVSPGCFFVNAVSDPRGCDMELVGCLRDMSMAEVLMRFSNGDCRRAGMLRGLYGGLDGGSGGVFGSADGSGEVSGGGSFFHARRGRCRVIEVWTLECRERLCCHDRLSATICMRPVSDLASVEAENAARRSGGLAGIDVRWDGSAIWHCRYLAPDGTVLAEYDSPLAGGGHPFAVKLYPLIDGEVHSLVEDVIDQQKYVNRLITLMDHLMGTAAKGVLLFPAQCKVEGQKWQEVAEMWSVPGAVIPYRPYQGAEPHQVVTPAADLGARDLLQTQIKLFEDVSGVSSALMGKSVSGVVGAERYENEVRQATVSINDLMETFADFVATRDCLMAGFAEVTGIDRCVLG